MNSQDPIQSFRQFGHQLKHWLFDYSVLVSTSLVFVMVLPCLFIEEARNKEYLVWVIGIGGGLSYFLLKHHAEEVRLFKELFEKFNERYDAMNEDLNAICSERPERKFSDEEEKNKLYDYFNLCAEEFLYYNKGFIYPEVWKAWLNGMRFFYGSTRIKKMWDTELERNKSYYGMTSAMLSGCD